MTADDRGPDFYDANGDGSISAADSLYVINKLSEPQAATGEQVLSESVASDWIAYPSIENDSRIQGTDVRQMVADEIATSAGADRQWTHGDHGVANLFSGSAELDRAIDKITAYFPLVLETMAD